AGLAHSGAALIHFFRPSDRWVLWPELFSLPATFIGLGAGVYAYVNAPKRPEGWRAARPWAIERVAPPVVYFGAVLAGLVVGQFVSPPVADVIWKTLTSGTVAFAFALMTWENLWLWRQWAEFPASR